MAGSRLKGITVEIGGDTTKLQTALKGVNNEIKGTETRLKDIEKLLKLDPGNTELLNQKYKTLQQEIGSTKEKLETLKEASQQADQALKDGSISQDQYDALQREIAETEQSLKSLEEQYKSFGSVQAQEVAAAGEKMKELGGKVEGAGKTLTTGVTVPLAAIGTAGAASFAEVDKTMTLANKTMGNSSEQAEMLNQAMKNAAANSTYGMNDAANATLNFARAGLNAEQSAAALAPAMNLAAGEGGNLDTVSGGLVATINGFHGSFDEAGHYADVFAAACNNSALDVDSLSDSMSVAAPIFNAAGWSVEDAALAMGLMGNGGIEASKAANSLKTGIARLVSPAKEGANALANLGFSSGNAEDKAVKLSKAQTKLENATATLTAKQIGYSNAVAKYGEGSTQAANAQAALTIAENKFEEAQRVVNVLVESGQKGMESYGALMVDEEGNMRSFEEVLGLLQKAFSGLSEKESIAAASAIFGKNQMAPWLTLIGTAPETVEALSTKLHGAGFSTDDFAKKLEASGGSISEMKERFAELGVTEEEFNTALETCGGVAEKFTESIWAMSDPAATNQELLDALGISTGELQKVMDETCGTTDAMAEAMMSGFGGSIEKLKSSIDVLVTSIGEALAPTIQKVTEFIQGFVDKFNALTPAQQQTIVQIGLVVAAIGPLLIIIGKLMTAVGSIMTWAPKIVSGVKSLTGIGGALMTGLKGLWGVIAANPIVLIVAGIAAAVAAFTYFWNTSEGFREFWTSLWESIKSVVSTAVEAIGGFFTTTLPEAFSSFVATIQGAWAGMQESITSAWESVKTTVSTSAEAVKTTVSTAWDGIKSGTATAWEAVKSAVSTAWDGMKSMAEPAASGIKSAVSTAWDGIKTGTTTAWEAVKTAVSTVWNGMKTMIEPAASGIKSAVSTAWDGIKSGTSTAWEAVKTAVSTAWNGMKTMIEPAASGIKSTVSTAWDGIKTGTTTAWETVKTAVSTAWDGMKSAIEPAANSIKSTVSTTWDGIKSGTSTAWEAVKTTVSTAWDGIKSAIEPTANGIKNAVSTAWDGIKSGTSSAFDGVKTAASTAWNGIKTTVTTVVSSIGSGISTGLNQAKSKAETILNGIKSAFTTAFNGVKTAVEGVVNKLKGIFNFSWELPKLKLPHFSISGRFSLNPPSVPHFSIQWYRKAMNNGMILNSPTIFGASGNRLLGGGEAGPEAVVGVSSLMDMIQRAVNSNMEMADAGNITIPVYIGGNLIDEMIVTAQQRRALRSGGRV